MKIYVCHSKKFDFKNELYVPLRNSPLNTKHEILFPHETEKFINSKEIIRASDFVIAEVSYPSTAEGFELGWADCFEKQILCIYKDGTKPSGSLKVITEKIISYSDSSDMVVKITNVIENIK
ncbi:MAG: hypothetical protein AAB508_03745 [Patescibacteria group bacterium]